MISVHVRVPVQLANTGLRTTCTGTSRYQPTAIADSKVQGANMGPTWVLSAPDEPHVGPMKLAIRDMTPPWHGRIFSVTDHIKYGMGARPVKTGSFRVVMRWNHMAMKIIIYIKRKLSQFSWGPILLSVAKHYERTIAWWPAAMRKNYTYSGFVISMKSRTYLPSSKRRKFCKKYLHMNIF